MPAITLALEGLDLLNDILVNLHNYYTDNLAELELMVNRAVKGISFEKYKKFIDNKVNEYFGSGIYGTGKIDDRKLTYKLFLSVINYNPVYTILTLSPRNTHLMAEVLEKGCIEYIIKISEKKNVNFKKT